MKVQLNTDVKTLDLGRSPGEDKLSATKGTNEVKMSNNQQTDFTKESDSYTPCNRIPGI
jgi:hypothetical protein